MIVISKFILCRSLCVALDVLERVRPDLFAGNEYVDWSVSISNLMVVLNSSSNFFVYLCYSRQFRDDLMKLCKCLTPQRLHSAADKQHRLFRQRPLHCRETLALQAINDRNADDYLIVQLSSV